MAEKFVHVDQVGYRTAAVKRAAARTIEGDFALIDSKMKRILEGLIMKGVDRDAASGDDVRWLDFSAYHEEGTYRLDLGGLLYSSPIHIARRPYTRLKNGLLKALYLMRCGTAVEERYAGKWHHGQCHTTPGYLYEDPSQSIDITGGWHDAGDYGKYTVPAAVAVAMLLLAFEHIPGAFEERQSIPESGNGVPDILNEARWEIQWMLKMQRGDGGVYHKATTAGFARFIMPEDDHARWVVCPVSATATGDFAASLAMASRIFAPYDGPFAARLLEAAQKAWAWLQANPNAGPFHNPAGVTTGEYGDGDVRDERLWAAAALFRATGEAEYAQKAMEMLKRWPDVDRVSFGCGSVGGFAAAEVLFAGNAPDELYKAFRFAFLSEAERLEAVARGDGYGVPLILDDYIWGSTMVLMNRAVHLLLAGKLVRNVAWEQTAEDCLHWLCGRNPLGVCYVSGFGSNPVMHHHNRISEADGVDEPVPGQVSGGPDWKRQDPAVQLLVPEGTPPARCFVDESASYSTNEITIYWNAPALFVAAWFDSK